MKPPYETQSDVDGMLASAKDAIVTVGGARGFLVQGLGVRVVTAAHCLPHLPPAHPMSFTEERTYEKLVGSLEAPAGVWAECLFVDPIADVAVLGQSSLSEECEAFGQFMEGRPTLRVAAVTDSCAGWLLTLDGRWDACTVRRARGTHTLTLVDAQVRPGMSGSPILTHTGHVIGVVSVGGASNGAEDREQHGQPALIRVLPSWFLTELQIPMRLIATQRRADGEWRQSLRTFSRGAEKKGGA